MAGLKALVVEYDLLTPYGQGLNTCWAGLLSGRVAAQPIARFSVAPFPCGIAALVDGLDPRLADSLALQMLGRLLPPARPRIPADTEMILATTAGEIDLLERAALAGAAANDAARLDRLAVKAARLCGLAGPGLVVSAACASANAAVACAAARIRRGQSDSVLVVACDSVTEFVFSGFSALLALDPEGARPFDAQRRGLMLGEACGYALLMSSERAARESRAVFGEVAGWGLTNDANHMTGPSRDGQGLVAAIGKALRSAGMEPDAIGSISAHGTGTPYNDAMELKAFGAVFGAAPRPTYSVKGGIGHTLGAAGLVEMLVALESLRQAIVPPTVNLRTVDPLAQGWVAPQAVSLRSAEATLSTNSGFGGINAALILKRGG
jgi:3-oxoacyl-[acyl-carrier-protein] synthase II